LNCELDAGEPCGLPVAGPLRFKFDRWLLPTTATRQSLAMFTEGTGLGLTLRPDYDVAARVIDYNLDSAIPGGMVWNLVLHDADQDENGFGFRAFDGNAIGSSISMSFRTSMDPPVSLAQKPKKAPSCADVLSTLGRAGCSRLGLSQPTDIGAVCGVTAHGMGPGLSQCVAVPRMGLALDDAQG